MNLGRAPRPLWLVFRQCLAIVTYFLIIVHSQDATHKGSNIWHVSFLSWFLVIRRRFICVLKLGNQGPWRKSKRKEAAPLTTSCQTKLANARMTADQKELLSLGSQREKRKWRTTDSVAVLTIWFLGVVYSIVVPSPDRPTSFSEMAWRANSSNVLIKCPPTLP